MVRKYLERLIERLENVKWNLPTAAAWIMTLGFVRGLLELTLFNYAGDEMFSEDYLTHRSELFFPTFYFAVFLTGVIIIKLFTGKKIEKVINISLPFYSLIILPPLLDRLLGNTTHYYYMTNYATIPQTIAKFPGFAAVVIYIIVILIGTYVFISSGIFKSLLSVISVFSLYLIYATTFPIKVANLLSRFSSYLPLRLQEQFERETSIEAVIYLTIALFALLVTYWIYDHKGFKQTIKSHFRAFRMGHYSLMVIWGYSLIGNFQPLRLFLLFSTLIVVALAWQFAVLINDLYDKEIDLVSNSHRGLSTSPLNEKRVKEFALVCAVLSLYIAFYISGNIFNIILILLALSYFYSAPPIQLRKYLLSPVIIGLSSFLAFLCGFLSQVARYSLNRNALITGAGIAVGMTLGTTLIDLKDIDGDKKLGVKSIPVIFGPKKSRKIVAFLVAMGYIITASVLFWITQNRLFVLVILPIVSMSYLLLKFVNNKKHWIKIFAVHYSAIISAILFQFIKI